ncbi:hypothetical protein Bca4012_014889 [Brassica carinata]
MVFRRWIWTVALAELESTGAEFLVGNGGRRCVESSDGFRVSGVGLHARFLLPLLWLHRLIF